MQIILLDLQLYCKRHYLEHVSGLTGPSLGTTLIVCLNDWLLQESRD